MRLSRGVVRVLLPTLAMTFAPVAGDLKWQDGSERAVDAAGVAATAAATEAAISMLSYRPETIEKDLAAASEQLTGDFRGSYEALLRDVVIPDAREQHISAAVTVPAAAVVSASDAHAVVMVFVDQTTTVGEETPTTTASTIKVILDRVDDVWLVSDFAPI